MAVTDLPQPVAKLEPWASQTTRLLIAVPFYKNEQLVRPILDSLLQCEDELTALQARIVLYNDSPDYPALAAELDAAVREANSALPISIRHNQVNLGWVKTASNAMQEALEANADILLMNSDTVVFPGAITEMARVSQLDPMIGFVNPRSNNATLASFPIGERFRDLGPEQAMAAHRELAQLLPRISYVPTAVGFALLVRRSILSEFGFFDEAYGKGYHEENDLVMRASRCGYRAVLANHAFVWHQGEQSFEAGARKIDVEHANGALLLRRYPEYEGLVRSWFDGPDYRAEFLISQLSPDANGKVRVAFDFSTFGLYHSGTQKAGIQLLATAARQWADRFDVGVLCPEDVFAFHKMGECGVERFDPHGPELFAAIFRVGQPFDWDTVRRMVLKGATVGVFMLDTISIDCSHLRDTRIVTLWDQVLRSSDFVVYNSDFTAQQFALRFPDAIPHLQRASLHSLDLDDYRLSPEELGAASAEIDAFEPGFILVFGNQYPHKAVGEIANRLASTFPLERVIALGVTADGMATAGSPSGVRHPGGPRDDKLDARDNLTGFRVGHLSDADIDALVRKSKFVVMPSHYEGFGIPIVHTLALEKPIVARRLPPLLEIAERMGWPANLHFFESTEELMQMVPQLPGWQEGPSGSVKNDAERAARDVQEIMSVALRQVSYDRIRARVRHIQHVFSIARFVPGTPAEFAAQRIAQQSEHLFRRLFKIPGVFRFTRLLYRIADTVRRR
ncbi:MAG: glycosyltransferase [Hyphomonadaceae bacterium]|nr:glycosyltransferase [Hyphomonadaceae bacterium]